MNITKSEIRELQLGLPAGSWWKLLVNFKHSGDCQASPGAAVGELQGCAICSVTAP